MRLPRLPLAWPTLDNPVLVRDFRLRMRGGRAFLIMLAYSGFLGLATAYTYSGLTSSSFTGVSPVSGGIGREMYVSLLGLQVVMVAILAPALTAGAICGEREQHTYEMLACTRLRARTLIVGKVLSTWLFCLMLTTCALPIMAASFLTGGVSLNELALTYAFLALFALFFASIGIFFSSLLARSAWAVAATYGVLIGYHYFLMMPDPGFTSHAGFFTPFGLTSDPSITVFGHSYGPLLPRLVWLPAMVLVFLGWAMGRLPHYRAAQPLLVRLLALVGVGVPLILGIDAYDKELLIYATPILLGPALFFVTGSLDPREGPPSLLYAMLGGLHPKRPFSNAFGGGWVYMLLFVGVLPACMAVGKLAGGMPMITTQDIWLAWAVMGAAVMGYAGLGALGAALGSRVASCALVAAGVLLGMIAPMYNPMYQGQTPLPTVLSPAATARALAHTGYTGGTAAPHGSWVLGVTIYLTVAAVALVLAEVIYQARRAALPAKQEAAMPDPEEALA